MSNPDYNLRAGASGPAVSGPAGDVLIALANGKVQFQPQGELNTQFVTATLPVTALTFTTPQTRKIVVTLDATTTFDITWPTTPRVVIIQVKQGAGAPFTPTFPSEVKFAGGVLPVWSTVAGRWDELAIDWDGVHGTVSFGTNYSP